MNGKLEDVTKEIKFTNQIIQTWTRTQGSVYFCYKHSFNWGHIRSKKEVNIVILCLHILCNICSESMRRTFIRLRMRWMWLNVCPVVVVVTIVVTKRQWIFSYRFNFHQMKLLHALSNNNHNNNNTWQTTTLPSHHRNTFSVFPYTV